MIKNIRHTGIVVYDLKIMADFYYQLGFVYESSAIEESDFIDQLVNISSVRLEWIKMKSPDGYLLELLKYHSHQQELGTENSKSNDLGCSHIAYSVENVDSFCEKVKVAGGSVEGRPITTPDGKIRIVYCHDPEGVLIEAVEVIK